MFASAAGKSIGANANLVLGQSDFVSSGAATTQNGLNTPKGLGVDASGNLYVADYQNNRILIYSNAPSKSNGASADKVLGQTTYTANTANKPEEGLNGPSAVAVTSNGTVLVADRANNRVLFYVNVTEYTANMEPYKVLGQPDFHSTATGTSASSMNGPTGVVYDDNTSTLYVSDGNNNRVLVFFYPFSGPNGQLASRVLGQSDFTSNGYNTTQNGMYRPGGLAVDSAGNLFVADEVNNRVLIFINASSKANGANADSVLGQSNFTSNSFGATTASSLTQPWGVAVDASDNLFVADYDDNRVLIYKNVLAKTNGSAADIVLGQTSFSGSDDAVGRNRMRYPTSVAVDGNGILYVADGSHYRVLVFKNAVSLSNGANANYVLGQANFTSTNYATSQSGMSTINGVAVDTAHGYLYVSDGNNNRVLLFQSSSDMPVGLSSLDRPARGETAQVEAQ